MPSSYRSKKAEKEKQACSKTTFYKDSGKTCFNVLLSWSTPTFMSEDAMGVIRELNEMFGHHIPQSSGVFTTRTAQLHATTKKHQITCTVSDFVK